MDGFGAVAIGPLNYNEDYVQLGEPDGRSEVGLRAEELERKRRRKNEVDNIRSAEMRAEKKRQGKNFLNII